MRPAARFLVLMATVATATGLVVGCGSSGDSTETLTTSSLSKAQWIKRAGAICTEGSIPLLGELNAYEEKNAVKTQRGNEKVAGEAIKLVIPKAVRGEVAKIRALGAPEGDQEEIEAFLLAMEEDVKGIEDGPLLSGAGDLEPKFRHSGQLASAYGIEECAYG